MPLFDPVRRKSQPFVTPCTRVFPGFASHQLNVFTSIFDWFIGLSMSFDWLERLSKVFLVLLHSIENHHKIITNFTITITGLVL